MLKAFSLVNTLEKIFCLNYLQLKNCLNVFLSHYINFLFNFLKVSVYSICLIVLFMASVLRQLYLLHLVSKREQF